MGSMILRLWLLYGALFGILQSSVFAKNNVIPTNYSNITCTLSNGKEGICVYAYLCDKDFINTDGEAIIDLRSSDECEDYFLKCCSKESPCNENKGTCLAKQQCKVDLNAAKYKDFKQSNECDWSDYQCCPNDSDTADDGNKEINDDEEKCSGDSVCVPHDQCLKPTAGRKSSKSRTSTCGGSNTCCPRNQLKQSDSDPCVEIGGTCIREGQCSNLYNINLRTEMCTEPGFECCMDKGQATTEGKPCYNQQGTCMQETNCGFGEEIDDLRNECDGLTCCDSSAPTTVPTSSLGLPCNDKAVCKPKSECKASRYRDKDNICGDLVCCLNVQSILTTEKPSRGRDPDCESIGGTCKAINSCRPQATRPAGNCLKNTVCCVASSPDSGETTTRATFVIPRETTTRATIVTPTTEVVPGPGDIKECGYRNENGYKFNTINRNDGESQYGEFPWMVAIMTNRMGNMEYLCGGTLIDPQVVLTTAECVKLFRKTPAQLTVRAGEWDMNSIMEPIQYQEHDVAKIKSHPKFKPNTLLNNIALLFLEEDFDLQPTINTICLPPQGFSINNGLLTATGWGATPQNRTKYQHILKSIDLPYVQNNDCERALRRSTGNRNFKLHSSFLCAGGGFGVDTCKGDGGGPAVYYIPNDSDSRYYAIGMVSWGVGCGRLGVPAVYTNIAEFRDWIDEEMEAEQHHTSSYTYWQDKDGNDSRQEK